MPDDYIFHFFERLPRQGPGADDQTIKALDLIRHLLNPAPSVLDLGCGKGAQTLALAQAMPSAFITAIDLYFPYLKYLQSRHNSDQGKIAAVRSCQASMLEPPFQANSFDLIWSEGAIYVAGFKNGLELFRELLHRQGLMAVTEAVWLTAERPPEVTDFWQKEYPAISTIAECRNIIAETGMNLISDFILPERCWNDNFYIPARTEVLAELGRTKEESEIEFLNDLMREIDMYDKYKSCYGYVFFIMQKI